MAKPDYYNYFVLNEAAVESDVVGDNFKVLEHVETNTLNFLRFVACVMVVNYRNRNQRYWPKDYMNIMMQAPHIVDYFTKAGGLHGENGHTIPMPGQVSMERLVTIDPNNTSFIMKKWWWEGDKIMGNLETLDDGEGRCGRAMTRNMLQGMVPAFSARTMVPQRRNADGTIDVIAPGRLVCFARVHGPSCEGAYQDVSVPVKNIIKKSEFETAMESFSAFVIEHSDAVRRVIGDMTPAMESAGVTRDGFVSLTTREDPNSRIFVRPERNFRGEIAMFMRGM